MLLLEMNMNLGVEIENGQVTVTTIKADAFSFKRILEFLGWKEIHMNSRNGFCKFVFPSSKLETIEAVFDLWVEHFETGEKIG